MEITSPAFKKNARQALADQPLQRALGHVRAGFVDKRAKAVAGMPEFEALRDGARDIKDHTLAHLDLYLEAYEKAATKAGGQVHWAETGVDAMGASQEIPKKLLVPSWVEENRPSTSPPAPKTVMS